MKVNIEHLKSALKKEVSERRYLHSIGVAETGRKLAIKYGEDPEKAQIAGILHDYTKYWPRDKLKEYIIKQQELSKDILLYSEELWHGPVASIVIQDIFKVRDIEIINAIRYHTSGREKMSLFEKILCLADYIEPTRDYQGIDQIRIKAYENINEALILAFDGTIQVLIRDSKKIYPLTLKARNYLLDEIT